MLGQRRAFPLSYPEEREVASWTSRLLGREERSLWHRADGDDLASRPLVGGDPGVVWVSADTWPGVLGRSADPESLPVTVRATSLITGPLTAAPYRLVDDATGQALPTPRWLGDPMLLRPDARLADGAQAFPHARRLTRSRFWTEVIRSAVWHGMGAFVYATGSDGAPLAGTLRQVHPGMLSIDGRARWVLGVGADTVEFDRGGHATIGGVDYRIAVMRNPLSPVGADGTSLGVFGLSSAAFETAASVDRYTAGTFKSGVPAGYLKSSQQGLTQPQVDNLKSAWMRAHGGDTRSIAVLNATTDFTPISFSPVDAQAVQIKRMALGDVAMAFGLPPEVLGVSLANSSTYVNIGDAWARLKSFGLSVWISELEDLLTSLVPYGRSVQVDTSEFEPDITTGEAPAEPVPEPQPDPEPEDGPVETDPEDMP